MRKLAFLTLLLALVAGPGFAQTEATPPPQDQSAQQPGAEQQQPANPDQPATSTETQQAPAAGQNASQETGTLPQTASPLPLLGLLGLGSFAAGMVARKRK